MEYGPPPYGKWTPSIPTLIMLHITLILLRIMYIAFPNLKHCKNKCLPVFLKIKKKNGPIQKHIRSLDLCIRFKLHKVTFLSTRVHIQ